LIKDSEAALAVDPAQENALFNLALGYLLSGDEAKAKAQYERACRDAKSAEVIAASLKDVEDAIAKRGTIAGSDEILNMFRKRMANANAG
jgi:Flp pilus assembly protein TadD